MIITLVTISVIQKLGPHFSLGRWILCSTGLIRYLYPTDSELRQLANVSKEKSKQKKGGKLITNGKSESFHIPRNLDVQLETAKVTRLDVVHLKYYSDFQWLMDFSVYAMAVYILTEVYQSFYPLKDEVNLSMMWCTLVLFFAVYLLLTCGLCRSCLRKNA